MKKIIFTYQRSETEHLKKILGDAWAGINGNYSHCANVTQMTGYFMPTAWANPTLGWIGTIEEVEEDKVEILCEDEILEQAIALLKKNHSYETPHIEIMDVELV